MKFSDVKIFFLLFAFLFCASCLKPPSNENSKKIKFIFLTEEYAPLNFTEKGKAEGMAVDVVNAMCEQLKIKPEIEFMLWKDAYKRALNEPNVILFSTTKTKIRENNFYWLQPSLLKFTEYFYHKNGSDITLKSLEEAKKYKIGTTADFYSEEYLKVKGFINLISYDTQEQTMTALLTGSVDLIILAGFRKEYLSRKMDISEIEILPAYKIDKGDLYIVISKKTSEEVVKEWQSAFDYIRENKTYYKIYKKWFLNSTIFN